MEVGCGWVRGCHKARFALQEGMFRGRPKVNGNRALSVWEEELE